MGPRPSGRGPPGRQGPSGACGSLRKADQEGGEGACLPGPRVGLGWRLGGRQGAPPARGPAPWTSRWQCCPEPGLLLHSGLKGHVCAGGVTWPGPHTPRGCLLGSTVVRGHRSCLRAASRTGRGFMRSLDTQPSLQLFCHTLPHGPMWLLELKPLNVYSSQWEREWVERPLFLPEASPRLSPLPGGLSLVLWPHLAAREARTHGCGSQRSQAGQEPRNGHKQLLGWGGGHRPRAAPLVPRWGHQLARDWASTSSPGLGRLVCIVAPVAPWSQQLQP